MSEELTSPEVAGDADGSYRREVENALDEDRTQLGDVWKGRKQNLTRVTIARNLGVSGVYNVWKRIDAIVEGKVPTAVSLAVECASALRGFSGRHGEFLSEETHKELARRASTCDEVANDPKKRKAEERVLERETHAHDRGPGIYVFTLPHYFHHAVEPADKDGADDRSYYKVGHSEADVKDRVQAAKREAGYTGVPESPLMLRKYGCPDGENLITIERKIHRLLEDADHLRNKGATKGTEWFLTHLKFLDSIALILGLTVDYEYLPE